MLIYAMIFICKIIEDALSTLRIIVVSNGKKVLGAILQFVIALIWVFVTGTVIINLQDDPWKVLFFALGSLVGSYIGSYIEEKIALGTNAFVVEMDAEKVSGLVLRLESLNFGVVRAQSGNFGKEILIITLPRKRTFDVIGVIKGYDKGAYILASKVKLFL